MATSESSQAEPSAMPLGSQSEPAGPTAEAQAQPPEHETPGYFSPPEPFWFMGLVASGATTAALCGLAVAVLAILGMSGVAMHVMLPAGGMVLGLAFLTLAAVDYAWATMFADSIRDPSRRERALVAGMIAVGIAGLAAVVLSLLNFAFLGNLRFLAIVVVILGLGMLWHSGVMCRVGRATHEITFQAVEGYRPRGPLAINALSLAPIRDFLVGVGAVVLGILAVMNIAPAVLSCVALLTMGVALAATVSTLCGASLLGLQTRHPKRS